ncbi:PKD domain-containing protein [Pseudaquabacterium pictum]|uniref:PKD domain-containing protein n=1 Tax=Pseudaquabacterium pictum TaxID=2315236 RepID=A0A480AR59_9BURK|nr:PKD domain-containing protein [Rubrivivax pictus]GCL64054.1 hypothetical protein AQPW35_31350 [Rubrivivax pictus]
MTAVSRLSTTLSALALLLAATLATPATAAGPAEPAATSRLGTEARVPHRDKGAFPQLMLREREARGQRAVDQLGARLPELAAWYGKSADEFRAHLLNDRSWRLDQRGRVFIVEEMDRPLPATAPTAAASSLIDGTLLPLDQTFLLHSKPGAARTIYLNFKGATLSGTAWNSAGTTINALPFDLDGIPYSFSTAELQRIQAIWQRVAEDYAPFDVNVTTEAVPADRITRAGSTDTVFGTTVLITSSTGVYSCSCGGVAYLGVFDDTSDFYKPALVFYNQLGAGNEKYVAEAISHEAGHNMGLGHDGTATVGYYTGHGSGATGWAPIMGVGYYQALVQWSKGEYGGANNTQDDFAVMQSNGLPLRADDHGNTAATATVLSGTSAGGLSTLTAQGVIERSSDVDMFSFAAGAGSASFTVSPAARAPNLDALVTLRNAAGTVLATINPADAVGASFSVTLPASGTYTLAVQGTGKGDPLATGYSAYGSLGQYAVAATVATPGSLAPTAVIGASALRGTAPLTVAFNGAGSSDADGAVVAWDWAFSEGGTAAGSSTSRTYTAPGSYTTTLRVTDNAGLSASASVTVTVDAPVVVRTMRVADIAMGLVPGSNGAAQASAAVKVLDSDGRPVVGAAVNGQWSGLVSRKSLSNTDANGVARFLSPSTRATGNSFRFAVTGVSRSGYTYAPLTNTETNDSIAR